MKKYNEAITIRHQPIQEPEKFNRIAFLASRHLDERLNRAAVALGVTKSLLIRSLIVSFLDDLVIQDEQAL